MRAEDLTVEVRDADLQRVGVISVEDLDFSMSVPHSNVATWKLRLPAQHQHAEAMRTPGSGVIVTMDGLTLMSGPMVRPTRLATADDPGGTIVFDGVSDSIYLADFLAWPDPANGDVATQAKQEDTRTGTAEALIHAFVNANIGPSGPVARRVPTLTMGANLGRGGITTKSARFQVLGEFIGDLALVADLGFQIVQRGDGLVFETSAINDLTGEIRLDVENNTLTAQKLTVSAPEITRTIVSGKHPRQSIPNPDDANGNPVPNTVIEEVIFYNEYTNAASLSAEAAWSRRIERFLSQTQTDDPAELQQAADERLADGGFTAVNVQVVPFDGDTMRFGVDWSLGDRVSVVVDGFEYVSVVTGYELRNDSDGFFLSANLGDPTVFDPSIALRRRVQKTEARLSALERNG